MTNRIDTIKQAVATVQLTRPATNKANNKLIKIVDSVIKSEYCTSTSKTDRIELLDFND